MIGHVSDRMRTGLIDGSMTCDPALTRLDVLMVRHLNV
jgi:hypothetical protein